MPKAPPPSPFRRDAQKASATACGACLISSARLQGQHQIAHQHARLAFVVAVGAGHALFELFGESIEPLIAGTGQLGAQHLADVRRARRWHAAHPGT